MEVNLASFFFFFFFFTLLCLHTCVMDRAYCNIPLNCRTKFLQYGVLVALQYCTVVELVHSTIL